jgi:long-chain acyl-CoA synthetase
MVGVPAVWETIRKGIAGKISAGSAVTKIVFNTSMKAEKTGILF